MAVWASLLASGRKQYETRNWTQGSIAIHAAKRAVRRILDALAADRRDGGPRRTTLRASSRGPANWTIVCRGYCKGGDRCFASTDEEDARGMGMEVESVKPKYPYCAHDMMLLTLSLLFPSDLTTAVHLPPLGRRGQ